MRKITVSVFALTASLMLAPSASAQMKWTDKGVVAVNVGNQSGSHSLTTDTVFNLYDEDGRLTSSQEAGGGPFFDISAGYKVWENLLVSIGYSHVSSKADAAIAASVPDPLRFDNQRPVTATLSDAQNKEDAIHLSGVWMVPVTDKIDVGVSAGPTIFMVKQDVPSTITVTEPAPTVASISVDEAKKTTVGFNAGVDVTYLLTKKLGAGAMARYTWGSAKLAGASDSLTVGGFQLGVGLRVRF
jgi:hypothetical protein